MGISLVFLGAVLSHLVLSLINFRAGVMCFIFFYGVYPRFFSLGLGSEGFALTGQRAMAATLFAIFLLRVLWGSAEIKRGYELLREHRGIALFMACFLAARLGGNFVTGRLDLGSIAALLGEILMSAFVVFLLAALFRSKRDVLILLILVIISLFLNQLVAVIEFLNNESIFPQTLDLQYEQLRSEEELLEEK